MSTARGWLQGDAERSVGAARGTVYLVGAGPGDPGLLTRRGVWLLRRAEVVIHDALVGDRILELANPDALLIDVGKRCGGRHTAQEQINQLLIESAGRARVVVRLKGGDPFVFGRGGEEALALAAAGIRFRVVPGVTAASGASAYAGIPLTHRDLASSVTFVTGHGKSTGSVNRVDWEALARLGGTLAIYMGVGSLASTAARLIDGGRSPETPVAVIEWGTYARQRTITGSLREIAARVRESGIGAPALVVVGEVAALRDRLGWFDRLPLRGVRVAVARSRAQPSRLASSFRRLGAEVAEYPQLRSAPVACGRDLDAAFSRLGAADWILFTSPAAVSHFWREAARRALDSRCLGGVRVAAFGRATTSALARRGIVADIATRTFDPPAVAGELSRFGDLVGSRILFPREGHLESPIGRELRALGSRVDEVEFFRVQLKAGGDTAPEILTSADFIVLPSSSSVRAIAAALDSPPPGARVVAIGPRTAQTALGLGVPVHSVAADHSVGGVVRAVLAMVPGGRDGFPDPAPPPLPAGVAS